MATSAASPSPLRLSAVTPGGTPPPGTVRAKISQLNASSSSIDTSSGPRSRASSVSLPGVPVTPPPATNMVSQRDTPNLSDSSHLRINTGSSIKTPRLEKDVRLVVDTRLRQHLCNLYKAEKEVSSADDVSDTEKLLAVMHSKNVNFTQEAIKIIIHLMALEENQQAIGRSVLIRELIRSLSAPQDAIRTYAAWALSNFSSNESNHRAIHDVGGIKALLSLLTSSSEDSLKQALSALLNISSNPMFVETIRKSGGMREMIRLLEYSGNAADAIIPLTLMVFINLATNEKNMEMFGDVGGFPPLIKLLHHPVFSMDAMPFLIALLNNPRRVSQFIAAEGLRPLFDFVSRAPARQEGKYDNSLEHCLLALHHLLSNEGYVRMIGERNFVLPLTALLDGRQDPRILVLVVEIIDTLLDSDERNGTQLVTASGIERLVALLPAKRPKRTLTVVVDNALLLLTGLLETNDNNQEHLLDRGVVPAVAGVMSWATNETLEHALHLIALLTSGVNGQVVYDEIVKPWPQVLPRLLQMLNADPANKRAAPVPDSTRIKIALCFSALLGHIDCHMDLVELEVVGHFIDLLASPNQRLQFYAITALRNLSTYYASVRREIQHLDGLGELLALVHGPNRAAVSVARLEAMRTIANLSVTDDPIDLQEFCDTSVPVLLAVLATPPPSRDDITRAVAKRKQRLSSGSQQDPNCNKITSFEMQQVREQKKGRDGSTISTPSPHDLGSGSHGGGGNPGNAGNSGTMLVRAARLTGANSSLNTNGRGSRVSNMESLGSGDLDTRIGNVGTVGSGGSRIIAVNSGASISGLGSQDDQEEDRMLEERVFQTKWENDCLIKAYTAITLQNLSIEADFVDMVHSAGGLGVVMEYLLGSSSPRLQYEAVRLLTVWAAQDANRMAFQEMGGIQRLEQALAAFQSSPVPNDALIMCTQIALNTMSIPPVELSERMMSLDDDDDSGIIGWEPETAILDYMRQVEHAIRAIELSNPLESYHSHSLPTSPKDSVTKSSRYSSQPVTLRRSVRQRERFDKYQRGGIKDASIFAQPGVADEEDKDQTAAAKVVGWREEVGVSQLLESSGPAVVPPSRLMFDQMEEMRDRMTGKPGVGDLTSLAPLSPSRGSRPRGSRASERREKNEDGKTSKSEAATAKKNEDESEIGEAEEKAPKRRGSFRQLSKQFSATLKKVHQTTTKAKTDNNPDADKGNGDDKDNKREKEKKKKKKKRSDKEKEKTRKKKEKEKEKSTKKKKKKAAKQKSSGVRGKPDGLGDGKEAYKWSVEEVGDWLEENSLGELRPVFAQHHIDGKALMQLHHAALSRMGIFSQPLSSALLQRRRKLLTRSTSLTAPPSDSSMGSSLSSSRSYPNLSSSSSSSVSVHARDKIVKDEEKRKHRKKSKDKAKAKEESGDKAERAKTKAKTKAKAKKGEGEKGEGAGHEQKQEKRRKKGSSKKKRRKTAGNDSAAEGEGGSTTTTTEAERESKVVPRKGSGDVDKKKPTAASAKPKVSSLRRRPTELSEDGKGKEKAFGEADAAGGNGGRRKELRFEGNVPDEDESELGGTLIDDLGKGKGEELLVLRDIRISLQEERELKSAAAGAGAEGGSEHRGSGRKRGGSSTRRRKQRQLAAAADEETDEDHPEQQAKSPRASAGAVPRAADPLQTQTQPKQAGFLRSISTIFHIRGNKHTAKQQRDPHHLDAASSQHSTASSAVDEVGDGAAAQPAAQAGGEEKKRGSWVRSAFLRRGRKGDGSGEERKNAIRRGSEEAELRNSKETARRQQKEQKQERERKKKQDKEKAKERNKLSRKNSSLLSRMAVSTKRGNQGSKKTMTFSLEEDVNYGSTTDTTTTHSHSRGRGDEGDLQDDDEDEMDDIRRKQGTPRVNLQRATSGDELLPLDGEGSVDHASYSETEEQEVADYSEVVHQTTMDSGSYPSTPKRGSTARLPTRQQLFSLTTARLQVITQLGPHRKRLMLDLLETERRYVALVTVLIRQFLKPLLLLTYTEQEQFLTEEELHSIFLNIGLLHSYNMIFLSNLTQRVHSWSDSQPVADVFLMLSDFLTAYGEYLRAGEQTEAVNRQRGWLYLFNDALLTTTEIEIAIRKTFPLQNKDAQDFCSFIPLEDIMTIDEAREYSTIVKVTCKGGRIITIKFDSTESKSLWLDHFVVIVAAHRQKTARYNPPDHGDDHLPPHYAPVPHGLASEESEFES